MWRWRPQRRWNGIVAGEHRCRNRGHLRDRMSDWFAGQNAGEVPSPALLLYPDRVRENIRRMIRIAGGTKRLRPHIKTHKLAEVVRMQLEAGITKYKCATIAEAEMAAGAGAQDILLAYPIVGPNVTRLLELAKL